MDFASLVGDLLDIAVGSRMTDPPGTDISVAPTGPFPAKAGPTKALRVPRRTGFSREAFDLLLIFVRKTSRHRQTRLGCRLNGGLVEWAEPHGCGESCPPPWMADGSGPTERGRSEGTPTKEGPNREQALLVTFSAFKSNSPKAKPEAVRPKLSIFTAQAQRNTSPATRCPNMSQHRKHIPPPCR
jgi:hypothetical protein